MAGATYSAKAWRAHDARFRAEGVSISRGGVRVINNISLSLGPGEAAVLRGPNGAGKTTLLRAFAGLLRIDAGIIEVISGDGVAREDASNCAVHCGPLNAAKSALTVDENLRFWAALYGAPKDAALRARSTFRLDRYAHHPAGALSTGLLRRLGLSRLILASRPIWFVDEPTASLDAASAGLFIDYVESHCANGGIAIVATHDEFEINGARNIALSMEGAQ